MTSSMWARRLVLFSILVLLCPIWGARAATVQFVVTDLPNVTPGEDLWRYDYIVAGRSFLLSEFFDVYFDPLLYGALTAEATPSADWDARILQQPNAANLPPFDRGMFDAFALVGSPSLAGTFAVSFVYLGGGIPGVQQFEIFGANSSLLESGLTSPATTAIPEPSTSLLSLLGLAGLSVRLRHARIIRR